MKKCWIALVVFLLIIPMFAVNSFAEGIVQIEVAPGYGGVVISGNVVPIEVDLNAVGEDVSGTLKVSYRDDDREMNVSSQMAIEVAEGSPKKYTLPLMIEEDVYSYDYENFILVEVLDASGHLIAKQSAGISELTKFDDVMTGVLSDRYVGFTYFNLAQPEVDGNYTREVNTVKMTEEILKESRYLNAMDILVVDGIEKQLSDEALQNIREWVEKGGTLLMSTGEQFKTQGQIAKLFDVKATQEFLTTESGMYQGLIQIDFQNPDFTEIGEMNGIYKNTVGNGQVILSTYSLSNKKIVEDPNNVQFIQSLIQEEVVNNGYQEAMSYDDFRRLRYILNRVPKENMPSLNVIMNIVLLYVLLVGPLGYIIIKKRKKTTLYWRMVTALSVLATIGVFIVGQGIDFNKAMVNSMTIIDQRSAKSQTTSFLGIKHSDVGDVDIAPEEGKIRWSGSFNYNEQPKEKVYYYDDKEHVVFKGIKKFQFVNMMIDNQLQLENQPQSILLDEDTATVQVVNPFDRPLEDVVIMINESTKYIGQMAANESLNIEIDESTFGTYGRLWDTYDFYEQFVADHEIENIYLKNSVVEAFFDSNNGRQMDEKESLMVFGWLDDDTTQKISLNNKVIEVSGKSFWVDKLELGKPKSNVAILPAGTIIPETVMQGETYYDRNDRSFYGYGDVRFEYLLPQWMEPSEVTLFVDGRSGLEYKIYNQATESWEEKMIDDSLEIIVDESYISDENKVVISMLNNSGDSFFGPTIKAKGEVKND